MVKYYIGGVVIALVFFLVGLKVGQSRQISNINFQGRSNNGGQMMGGQFGTRGGGMRGGGIASGKVVSSDDKSITISLNDGGTKTIYISGTTTVSKSAAGTKADLVAGSNVVINGTANQDGSIAATSVQIRPEQTLPKQ